MYFLGILEKILKGTPKVELKVIAEKNKLELVVAKKRRIYWEMNYIFELAKHKTM